MKKFRLVIMLTVISVAGSLLKTVAQTTEATPRDLFYDKTDEGNRQVVPYPFVREADVLWQKRLWRVIDANQKINLPFRYEGIDFKDAQSLVDILWNSVQNKEVTAYQEDNFKTVETADEINKKVAAIDTVPKYDLDGNFIKDTIIQREFDPTKVTKYRVKEDWFFDKQRSEMAVRIEGIAPVYYDDATKSDLVLFWLYFPDLRSTLVKYNVFNPKNDAMRMSWDDLFEMRLFSSYVYKESNVFDRRVQDYATGPDALRESDKIKDEILNYEQNLWSY